MRRDVAKVLGTLAVVAALAFGLVDGRAVAVYLDAVGACAVAGGTDAR